MYRIRRALSCALLLASAFCQAQSTMNVVLSNDEYPPYVSERLPGFGVLSRVVTEAFKLQNVQVRYVFFPNNRTLQSARTGAVDGSLGWAKTPERQRDLLYTDPVMNLRMVFFQRKDHPVKWQQLRDLAGYRIGATTGNTYSDEFAQLQQAGVLKVETAPDDVANFRKLMAGHLDLFPIDAEVGAMLLMQAFSAGQRQQIEMQGTPFWSAPMHVVIWKGQPQAAELVRRFNLGLQQLRRTGEFNRLVSDTREQIYQRGTLP
ncbi:MAG: transporter substrate-binding domain-containing protein [Paludibacterium sp.]|uniref:substrate-binding periplasmic protein n=1 Tax=Paludibacterium sp. TaxID=1917523 RepID=UPI0025FE3B1E|nr:transporter substrate-binding domain-containing protein [Paludibacterium sp.]MBV8047123.1 transporter substrate-binding domain-containing protein [Paludibacterium sp.]MBV8648746.1 transporter substrate-binding domain-containing protein [Paludibacterium sp.]